jgi:hypothetical protein
MGCSTGFDGAAASRVSEKLKQAEGPVKGVLCLGFEEDAQGDDGPRLDRSLR